jgi:hypothetical protein
VVACGVSAAKLAGMMVTKLKARQAMQNFLMRRGNHIPGSSPGKEFLERCEAELSLNLLRLRGNGFLT